jgi:hypothetical protein
MGVLESRTQRFLLTADHLIGREPTAALRLTDESVSWRHASLRWTGQIWELQDLGSSNGTFLNGVRVAAGARTPLKRGCQIRFGTAEEVWRFTDPGPPMTSLVDLATGERVFASDDLIALPSPEAPELFLSRQANEEWIAELAEKVWHPQPLEVLSVAGRQFRFEPSSAVSATVAGRSDLVTPAAISLEFSVARDEEYVELVLCHARGRMPLRPRAHTYLLLTLARLRLHDQSTPEIAPGEQGWVYQGKLVKMLATSAMQLSVDMYRARKQFSDAGVVEAAQIIECRTTSHELRIGVSKLEIRPLGSQA